MLSPATPEELSIIENRIDAWLEGELSSSEVIVDVTRDPDIERRWYVRLAGEQRDFTAIWLTLGQRTLKYESYVFPAPHHNHVEFYGFLLRQNYRMVGANFGIGPEDAVFLTGELAVGAVTGEELDRVVGTIYETVERLFKPALHLGFTAPEPNS